MLTPDQDGPPAPDTTRPSLLLRLRNPRDDEAWRVFVETYTPLVYGYCRRRGLQASDVSDVTQEVMVQVSHSIRDFSYQPERGRFRDWLGTLTRTKLIGFLPGTPARERRVASPRRNWSVSSRRPSPTHFGTRAFRHVYSKLPSAARDQDSRRLPGSRSSVPGSTARPRTRPPWN